MRYRARRSIQALRRAAHESHHGTTEVGPGAEPFVALELGHGNDGTTDGARQGQVIGTYLHGPLLARNPSGWRGRPYGKAHRRSRPSLRRRSG